MAEEGKPLPNPLDEVSLAKYLETERALLCLYGDVNSRRKSYGHVYATLEAGYYRRLRRLREIFKTSGHPDLVACVERFISEWVEQVESPNGYTRILAEYYLAIEKETAYMAMIDNNIDWQSCIRGVVVSSAGFLVRAGYTPKWLSEIERTPEPKVWPVYD